MAEKALFSLATKVAFTVASPLFQKVIETACSIWGANEAVDRLNTSIQYIRGRIQAAEENPENSNNLIGRVRDVLYDAEDLFDEVATNLLLKQQMADMRLPVKKVKLFFSKLNPIISGYLTSKEVKSIRQTLDEIRADMAGFQVLLTESCGSSVISGEETQAESDIVIGRERDKETILGYINDKNYANNNISVIAIVGIGGMGKSTLAQYVYNDQTILNDFGKERMWWACISSARITELDVAKKIYSSITPEAAERTDPEKLSLNELRIKIQERVRENGKYFLVLDNLWVEGIAEWKNLLKWLSSDSAKGSKIIITTRNEAAATAIRAHETHNLEGLTNQKAWEMFKSCAFNNEDENANNDAWIKIGKTIMQKCANVPLAIQSIANILNQKNSLDDWKYFLHQDLANIDSSVLSKLRVSYSHLPQISKQCFAFCYLFKKGYEISKKDLIRLWIAHGYVYSNDLELQGSSIFNELVRRCFLQREYETDFRGHNLVKYKIHDLNHDLAKEVAGGEFSFWTEDTTQIEKKTRHISAGCMIDESWNIPSQILAQSAWIRTVLLPPRANSGTLVLHENFMKLRFVRALYLEGLNIKEIPKSIKKLKHIRYLNLSKNTALVQLPNSITKLVNLLTLELYGCTSLAEFPRDFWKLTSLRHLDFDMCPRLVCMPSKFGELTSLKNLSDYKVSRGGDDAGNGVEALSGMNLSGSLMITYDANGGWSGDEMRLGTDQISKSIDILSIYNYPNVKIPVWWGNATPSGV